MFKEGFCKGWRPLTKLLRLRDGRITDEKLSYELRKVIGSPYFLPRIYLSNSLPSRVNKKQKHKKQEETGI